jgi:hypothetical protein
MNEPGGYSSFRGRGWVLAHVGAGCAVLWDGLPSVLWGYWLMWMAIASSLAAEVYDTRRPGRVPRPSPSIDAEANVNEQDAVLAQPTEVLLK